MNSRFTYQIYNFQPSAFNLLTIDPLTEGYIPEQMMLYWNVKFKMPFLKYLNQQQLQSFTIPPSVYSWIDQNLTDSISTFKFDLYDKFSIINLQPNYQSTSLIYLFANYIQSVLPKGPDGKPFTFT